MINPLKTTRIVCIAIIMGIILSIYASALYELQIVKGETYLAASGSAIAYREKIEAARGSILDRNGKVLVESKTAYNIVFDRSYLMDDDDPNGIILEMCRIADENNVKYVDTFPVTAIGPFSYIANMTDTQRSRLATYKEYFSLDNDILASDLIAWQREHYKIDFRIGMDDARKIIGVRYEMECRLIIENIDSYSFIEDAAADEIAMFTERNYPGVKVKTTLKRTYSTKYAAHILGHIGKMSDAEYERYKDKEGYNANTDIGKEGIEAVFEEYLHGVDGTVTYTTDKYGNITGILSEEAAVAGDNVYLTIDLDLQKAAEEALAKTIDELNASKKEGEDGATGGAVVVRDVNSGEVLVLASNPTFDLSTFSKNYSELSNDPLEPLMNRATNGRYNPGSTFKMVTAFAALTTKTITVNTTIEDKSRYTAYESYQPTCWVYPYSHGVLNVVGALENSCNYFFYTVADKMDIDDIEAAAKLFGFGEKTGIEIPEDAGIVASREYKKKVLNEGWWAADTLLASIGQGHNYFTPIQIANYIATIANNGTLYKSTLLKEIKSSDYMRTVYTGKSEVRSTVPDPNGYLSVLRRGMRAVAATGTAKSVFGNYPVRVAAKTGTVQTESSSQNTGVFVCYAPYDNPEIAISVVVQGGRSGSTLAGIAKEILDVYFASSSHTGTSDGEYSLVR